MRKGFIQVCLIITISAVLLSGYSVYKSSVNNNDDVYNMILNHINSRGELVDIRNEIGYHGIDSIKLFYEDKVRLHFGFLKMTYTKEEFLSDENIEKLKKIGITVKVNKTTRKLTLYYNGEEVQRWVD